MKLTILIFILVCNVFAQTPSSLSNTRPQGSIEELSAVEKASITRSYTDNKFTRSTNTTKSAFTDAKNDQLKAGMQALAEQFAAVKTALHPSDNMSAFDISKVQSNKNLAHKMAIAGLNRNSDRHAIYTSPSKDTPFFIHCDAMHLSKPVTLLSAQQEQTLAYISSQKNIFLLQDPHTELFINRAYKDELGFSHIRFSQKYKGIPIYAGQIVSHYDPQGRLATITARYFSTPTALTDVNFQFDEKQAKDVVFQDLNISDAQRIDCQKMIYIDEQELAHLCWQVDIAPTLAQSFLYFIDAKTGEIVYSLDNLQSDGPVTVYDHDCQNNNRQIQVYQKGSDYYMLNTRKEMFDPTSSLPGDPHGAIMVLDAGHTGNEGEDVSFYYVASKNSSSWDGNAVSLAFSLSQTFDYYKNIHNHISIDSENKTFDTFGIVNLGTNYANAFWNPSAQMFFFGNGDQVSIGDLACSLDIIAHEYGHAITSYSSQLAYEYQSGALNEAFSDFSGTMVEFYTSPTTANWYMGEGSYFSGGQYIGMRSLENPHDSRMESSYHPAKMSEYYYLDFEQDNGGVHVNCTIPGHAIYLISQKVGRQKMEKIVYRAFVHYLTPQAQFIDLRLAAIQAAKDLYSNSEANLVAQAFDEVEIFDGNGSAPPDPYSPIDGEQAILCVTENASQILSIKPDIPFQTENAEYTGLYTMNKPSVNEDGSIIAYIDTDGQVNLYNPQSGENSVLESDIDWHSIAVSPDMRYIALVPDTDLYPSTIGVIDMALGTTNLKPLYLSTTGTDTEVLADYADILDWSNDGGILLYDCKYSVTKPNGSVDNTWGLYLTAAESENAISLFSPSADYSVGNPAFSNTRDNIIAFDFFSNTDDVYAVCTYDMFTGELGLIHENVNGMGHPSFSPDDQRVVFQDKNSSDEYYLAQIEMAADGLNGNASSFQSWVKPVKWPVWYAAGERSGYVLEENFDTWDASGEFPPSHTGWTMSTTCEANTWELGNYSDYSFSAIDPENVHSAVVSYSATEDQKEELFTPFFDLPAGQYGVKFWLFYHHYWLTNYDVNLWISINDEWQRIWKLSEHAKTNFKNWQEFTVDLSSFQNKNDMKLCWQYIGLDGSPAMLDNVKIALLSGLAVKDNIVPDQFYLRNYPNPFNPSTTFEFSIPTQQQIEIRIFNIAGQLLEETMMNATPGVHHFVWDAKEKPSGIYLFQLKAGSQVVTRKCMLLK